MAIEQIEKEFLSILFWKEELVVNELKIKPDFLINKEHSLLLEAMLDCLNTDGVISARMFIYKEEIGRIFSEVINEDCIDIINFRAKKQFIACQKEIIKNYKSRAIAYYTDKLLKREINESVFTQKVENINLFGNDIKTQALTEEEILSNINTANIGIKLEKFPKLNEFLKLVQGDFLIIGASTGTGKSGLLLNLANELMNNYQCIYFNIEMSKSTIYKRMLSIRTGIQLYDIENPKSDYQKETIKKVAREIANNNVIVEHQANTLSEIKRVLDRFKDTKKHTILFLDHVGLVKSDNKKSIYENTTEVAKQLRQFCLDYDCTIISASQLNRTSQSAETLNLSMLKDSGELENSASKVILLYKDKNNISKEKYVENMVLDIVKNRDGQLGKIAYKYEKTKQIFKEENNYNG